MELPLVRPAMTRSKRERCQTIVASLKEEIAQWVNALETDEFGSSRVTLECPICGRTCDRVWNMQRHALTHTTGKLSTMFMSLESDHRIPHPVFVDIVRALYDHDTVKGCATVQYATRTRSLLTQWLRFTTASGHTQSLFTLMGNRDTNLVLVFTGTGPEYWLRTDNRLGGIGASTAGA